MGVLFILGALVFGLIANDHILDASAGVWIAAASMEILGCAQLCASHTMAPNSKESTQGWLWIQPIARV